MADSPRSGKRMSRLISIEKIGADELVFTCGFDHTALI